MRGPTGRPAAPGDQKAEFRLRSDSCRYRSTSTRGARAARSHSMTDRVAVIGAGQMGNGIAHVFAQSGIPVTMIDVSEDALQRGRATIEKNMDRQVKKNTLSADDKHAALGRIATSTELLAAAD